MSGSRVAHSNDAGPRFNGYFHGVWTELNAKRTADKTMDRVYPSHGDDFGLRSRA